MSLSEPNDDNDEKSADALSTRLLNSVAFLLMVGNWKRVKEIFLQSAVV